MKKNLEDPDSGRKRGPVVVTLCGVQGCCPTVTVLPDKDEVIVTDDFGGRVKLTKKQWNAARTDDRLKV